METSEGDSEKAMAPHSSTLAWKIPWTEEPGGLPSMGSQSQTRLKRLSSSSSSSREGDYNEPHNDGWKKVVCTHSFHLI